MSIQIFGTRISITTALFARGLFFESGDAIKPTGFFQGGS